MVSGRLHSNRTAPAEAAANNSHADEGVRRATTAKVQADSEAKANASGENIADGAA